MVQEMCETTHPLSKVQPAKEINKNFSQAHRMIDLREAHMKLDPLQDIYPKREEDIRRFISTS